MKYLISVTLLSLPLLGCDFPDPEQIRENQFLPDKNFKPNIRIGEAKYNSSCSQCHGKSARGSSIGPPLVHKLYLPNHHADQSFRWAVRDGVKQHHWHFGDMPKMKDITPEDIANIILYVRTEQRNAN